jgi:hypothetical protein
MDREEHFYICPICFRVCENDIECHAHQLLECRVGGYEDDRRKPVKNRFGKLVSRAPRWYLEAQGWVKK